MASVKRVARSKKPLPAKSRPRAAAARRDPRKAVLVKSVVKAAAKASTNGTAHPPKRKPVALYSRPISALGFPAPPHSLPGGELP